MDFTAHLTGNRSVFKEASSVIPGMNRDVPVCHTMNHLSVLGLCHISVFWGKNTRLNKTLLFFFQGENNNWYVHNKWRFVYKAVYLKVKYFQFLEKAHFFQIP